MEDRVRTSGVVVIVPASDSETAATVERHCLGVLLIDIHPADAVNGEDIVQQKTSDTITPDRGIDEKHLQVPLVRAREPDGHTTELGDGQLNLREVLRS